jgi:hypothetical protein
MVVVVVMVVFLKNLRTPVRKCRTKDKGETILLEVRSEVKKQRRVKGDGRLLWTGCR